MATAKDYAAKLLDVLNRDRESYLLRIDDYIQGKHDDPYMPASADAEYKLLAQRAVSNWIPLLISTPAQALYVDSYRRGRLVRDRDDAGGASSSDEATPEWDTFERSGLASKQVSIHRSAIAYGHCFAVTSRDREGRATIRGVSPLRASALFDDPANDLRPEAFIEVKRWPKMVDGELRVGTAEMYVGGTCYDVTFESLTDPDSVTAKRNEEKSGITEEAPVVRFAAHLDLEGRTTGVVWPVIPLQNRINQSVFDLLVAQTYGSFQVRTATGMAPPMEMVPQFADPSHDDEFKRTGRVPDGAEVVGLKPKIDPNTGQPVFKQFDLNARRMLFAEDPEARFSTLEGTPLDGFIKSIDMSIRHLSAISQTPPHYLLGQIANLSAEALQAAETSLSRMIEQFRKNFGESWEMVFRISAEVEGLMDVAADYSGEILWRDMDLQSISAVSDGLGKLAESLGIPKRGLWSRVPGVTKPEIDEWTRLAEQETPELQLADAINRASAPRFQPLSEEGESDDSPAA